MLLESAYRSLHENTFSIQRHSKNKDQECTRPAINEVKTRAMKSRYEAVLSLNRNTSNNTDLKQNDTKLNTEVDDIFTIQYSMVISSPRSEKKYPNNKKRNVQLSDNSIRNHFKKWTLPKYEEMECSQTFPKRHKNCIASSLHSLA